jgi:hypothetical protein
LLSNPADSVHDLDVLDGRVYLATDDGLRSGWLRKSGHLEVAGTYEGVFYGVAASGATAWLTRGSSLVALDVTDLSRPTWLRSIDLRGVCWEIDVVDGFAFVAERPYWDNQHRMWVYDISDLNRPRFVDEVQRGGPAFRVNADAGKAFVAQAGTGLRIYKYGRPEPPRFTTTCGTTNQSVVKLKGTAPADSRITLYVDGKPTAEGLTSGETFSLTVTLQAGDHEITADALNAQGRSKRSEVLAVGVRPDLPYDPLGVTIGYLAGDRSRGEQPIGRSGCVEAKAGWSVRPPPGVPLRVTVPISYTSSAAISVTLGTAIVELTEGDHGAFSGDFPPIDDLVTQHGADVPFLLDIMRAEEHHDVRGRVLTNRSYLPVAQ